MSFRERQDVPWRPSALYASLRKYIDHPANRHGSLIVVYRHLHGRIEDVDFPIRRGSKTLIENVGEFRRRIKLVDALRALARLDGTPAAWILQRVRDL